MYLNYNLQTMVWRNNVFFVLCFNTFEEEKVQLSDKEQEIVMFLQHAKENFSDVLIPAQSIIKYNSLGEGTCTLRLCE